MPARERLADRARGHTGRVSSRTAASGEATKHPVGLRAALPAAVRRRFDPDQLYGLRLTLFAIAFLLVFIPFGLLPPEVLGRARRPFRHRGRPSSARLGAPLAGRGVGAEGGDAVGDTTVPLRHHHSCCHLLLAPEAGSPRPVPRRDHARRRVARHGGQGRGEPPASVARRSIATAHGKSFPSGHAMSSVVVYGALLLVFFPALSPAWRRRCVAGAVVLVLAIGFSRLALGVHYISDVVGGYVLGLAWLAASTAAFSIWRVERGRRPVEPTERLEPEAGHDLRPHHAA